MPSLQSLPVLMYHYISRCKGAIAVSPEHFEDQCRGMAEHGWRGIGLAEAEAFLRDGEPLPPRSVLITFDDGFLDNYVHAWPILKRYGHQGVVFAVTERLDTTPHIRPTSALPSEGTIGTVPPCDTKQPPSQSPHATPAEAVIKAVDQPMYTDTLGFTKRHDLFLSWEEARLMEQSGVMHIAAHSARHLAVFAAPTWGERKGKPLHTPEERFHFPTARNTTFYNVDAPMVWGLPRFKERPALHSRAFLPSQKLIDRIKELVPQEAEQAIAFMRDPQCMQRLEQLIFEQTPDALGHMESQTARRERLVHELEMCQTTLRTQLGHPVHSLCWPWGSGSDLAQRISREMGFSVWYTTKMGANPSGAPEAVHRFKVRDEGWPWLRLRLELYSHSWLAKLYAACRL